MDADSLPDTFDFEGSGSAPYLLQASITQAFAFGSGALEESQYGALNLIFSPAPTWTMVLELLHGRLVQQVGQSGESTRLQASVQYSFVK